jgi:hypothetical protein
MAGFLERLVAKFVEVDVPKITDALGRIATALENGGMSDLIRHRIKDAVLDELDKMRERITLHSYTVIDIADLFEASSDDQSVKYERLFLRDTDFMRSFGFIQGVAAALGTTVRAMLDELF